MLRSNGTGAPVTLDLGVSPVLRGHVRWRRPGQRRGHQQPAPPRLTSARASRRCRPSPARRAGRPPRCRPATSTASSTRWPRRRARPRRRGSRWCRPAGRRSGSAAPDAEGVGGDVGDQGGDEEVHQQREAEVAPHVDGTRRHQREPARRPLGPALHGRRPGRARSLRPASGKP